MASPLGTAVPELLLPSGEVDYEAWAVIACDQFTQDRAYWEAVERRVADAPSALRLVLPEIDLLDADARVGAIHAAMDEYLKEVLTRRLRGYALVRRTRGASERHGLLLAVDLERYDYREGSSSLIRATEGTIVERLPPRMKIRRGASLECPHILLLVDDPGRTLIEPLFAQVNRLETLYDFPLMMKGGRLTGWAVTQEGDIAAVEASLAALASDEGQRARYGPDAREGAPLLFAVGDGNHSLASAKACWEERKASLPEGERDDHPARFALVEVCNLHDPGLVFAPIHRILLDVDAREALRDLASTLKANAGGGGGQRYLAVDAGGETELFTPSAPHKLPVGSLQGWIDDYLARRPSARADYIHGEAELRALARGERALGFVLPAMDKGELFAAVLREGALPRKTFSMGDARDKRYYMECRRLLYPAARR